jgi:hypothetical protein
MEKSGYENYEWHIVNNMSDVMKKCDEIKAGDTGVLSQWQEVAIIESIKVKDRIRRLVHGK